MEEKWLVCEVHPGMFSDEKLVVYRPPAGEPVHLFVPSRDAEGDDKSGRVRVRVFRRNDRPWAVLPSEYSESTSVDEADLVAS